MSSFKTLDLFNSGPHRFHLGAQGHLVTQDFFFGGAGGGSTAQGLTDLEVIITGRLIAATESALWSLRDAIVAQLLDPPTPGTLIDNHARSFTNMSFVTFQESDRTDRARTHSLAYTATFRRF